MAIIGPTPWVNQIAKISIFRLFKVLVFVAQISVFSFENIVKDIFLAYIASRKKLGKMANFGTKPWEMSFAIFQNEKTTFQPIKTRSLKSRKIDIFPKRLTHGFGPKMAIYRTFLFRQYRPGKCLLRYSRTKKQLSRL